MREIHNPEFVSQNTGGSGNFVSVLALLVLAITLFFSFQYVQHPKQSGSVSANKVKRQTAPEGLDKATLLLTTGQSVTPTSNFGWLTFIAGPLYLALRFLHDHGIGNWGWSIIVLTVIFNLLIIWPRIMSMKSSLKMMRVQPKVDALKKRYAHLKLDDPKRVEMNAEMMALYKAEGASMFGGCLPLLLQMPLLLAYFSVLRNATELHQAHWLWLADLSAPDPLHILPVLIIGSMVLTQYITPTPGMNGSHRWMFATLMPVVAGISLWHYASGLSLYWVTGNMINLLIQFAVNRSELGQKIRTLAAERRTTGQSPNAN